MAADRQRCSKSIWRVVAVAIVVLCGMGAPTVHASEVCTGEVDPFGKAMGVATGGRICLLDPPSPAAPLGPLPTFQLRVPANVNRIDAVWRGFDQSPFLYLNANMQPVAQGPPGGSSIWQGTITPYLDRDMTSLPHDGTLSIDVKTWAERPPPAYNTLAETATFADLLVIGGAVTVKRRHQRYVATYLTTVRGAATLKVGIYISASKEGNYYFPGKIITNRASSAGGVVQATAWLPRSRVLKKCQPYVHCTIRAEAKLAALGLQEVQTAGIAQPLKVK
jgi:hypothetical protein